MKNFFKKHDEITKDENDNLKQFDENGKIIIYVYDKDFDAKNMMIHSSIVLLKNIQIVTYYVIRTVLILGMMVLVKSLI